MSGSKSRSLPERGSMKNIIVLILLILFATPIFGQESQESSTSKRSNVLFGEVGGSGLLFSINYERLLGNNLGARIGAGSAGLMGLTIPVLLNYYIGREKKLELGLGLIYTDYFSDNGGKYISNGKYLITGTIAHKFQSEESGIVFRFAFTPVFNPFKGKFLPYGGISAGYAF